jgi:hypothetical protein
LHPSPDSDVVDHRPRSASSSSTSR